jgi:hypothetical protein
MRPAFITYVLRRVALIFVVGVAGYLVGHTSASAPKPVGARGLTRAASTRAGVHHAASGQNCAPTRHKARPGSLRGLTPAQISARAVAPGAAAGSTAVGGIEVPAGMTLKQEIEREYKSDTP